MRQDGASIRKQQHSTSSPSTSSNIKEASLNIVVGKFCEQQQSRQESVQVLSNGDDNGHHCESKSEEIKLEQEEQDEEEEEEEQREAATPKQGVGAGATAATATTTTSTTATATTKTPPAKGKQRSPCAGCCEGVARPASSCCCCCCNKNSAACWPHCCRRTRSLASASSSSSNNIIINPNNNCQAVITSDDRHHHKARQVRVAKHENELMVEKSDPKRNEQEQSNGAQEAVQSSDNNTRQQVAAQDDDDDDDDDNESNNNNGDGESALEARSVISERASVEPAGSVSREEEEENEGKVSIRLEGDEEREEDASSLAQQDSDKCQGRATNEQQVEGELESGQEEQWPPVRRHLPQYLFNGTTFYGSPPAAPMMAAAAGTGLLMNAGPHAAGCYAAAAAAAVPAATCAHALGPAAVVPAAYIGHHQQQILPAQQSLAGNNTACFQYCLPITPFNEPQMAARSQAANFYLPQATAPVTAMQQQCLAGTMLWLPAGMPAMLAATAPPPFYSDYAYAAAAATAAAVNYQQLTPQHNLIYQHPSASVALPNQPPPPPPLPSHGLVPVVGAVDQDGHHQQQVILSDNKHHQNNGAPFFNYGQLKLGYNLIPLLPIDAQPTRTRQAYGMDKVWQDEFEQLFSQFVTSSIVWTLVEVETNPSIRQDCERILAYRGRFIVRVATNGQNSATTQPGESGSSDTSTSGHGTSLRSSNSTTSSQQEAETKSLMLDVSSPMVSLDGGRCCSCTPRVEINDDAGGVSSSDIEASEHASGRSSTSSSSSSVHHSSVAEDNDDERDETDRSVYDQDDDEAALSEPNLAQQDGPPTPSQDSAVEDDDVNVDSSTCANQQVQHAIDEHETATSERGSANGAPQSHACNKDNVKQRGSKPFPMRFKMFIDSAKVRFCCDNCGHGWTSMKGRVVFWYELFELVDNVDANAEHLHTPNLGYETLGAQSSTAGNLVGYCAYKLFGQQCDICKIEDRFERPMWYPEEVTKVLGNLYNKIGQVYFGFRMPAIDRQRRAGKPKTSHNSSLCQACHDGVCTDRK